MTTVPSSAIGDSALLRGIQKAVGRTPAKAAIADARRTLSYRELAEQSDCAATTFLQVGVRSGDRVAVAAEKRVEAVVAMLGALKCGAAFVPLDAKAPESRLGALLDDAGPKVVVGRLPRPTASVEAFALDEAWAGARDELPRVRGEDVAYCMYTSGSSGRPKGVPIDHDAITTFIAAVDPLMEVDEGSRCLNTSPFFFDVSVIDVWYPLAKGATVYLTDDFLVPDRVLDVMEQQRVTHFSAVGSILTLLRRAARPLSERQLDCVTRIMTGAEIVDPASVDEWLAAAPGATVFNGYGPTEATCCCFAHPITRANVDDAPYPIGRPFPGTQVAVVGLEDEPCAPGTVGELLLSGPQVTKGYLRRPEEDERRLVERDGRRWYRTGDLVVEDETGVFHFRGRRDHELKVRGYRIHPAEVTAALQRCEGVGEAHVTTAPDERGERALVAAVSPVDGAVLQAAVLRARLREQLPDYMVPRRVLVLEHLPKLPSGKIDDGRVSTLFGPASAPAG